MRLSSISDEGIKGLSAYKGWLFLDGLPSLSDTAVEAFGKKNKISLMGLQLTEYASAKRGPGSTRRCISDSALMALKERAKKKTIRVSKTIFEAMMKTKKGPSFPNQNRRFNQDIQAMNPHNQKQDYGGKSKMPHPALQHFKFYKKAQS